MVRKKDTEMYSSHTEGKCVVAEMFIRTLKIEIVKYTTSISKNVYIIKLDNLLNKFSKTYQGTMKLKHVDVKQSIDFEKGPKFKVGDNMRIWDYQKYFCK